MFAFPSVYYLRVPLYCMATCGNKNVAIYRRNCTLKDAILKLTAAAGRCTREILKTLVRVTAAIVGSLDRHYISSTGVRKGILNFLDNW